MSPKDETCSTNIPAFLSKLWKIVNDPGIDNIVCWSADGRSFVIQDQAQFWYNILPIYYKHNNMSSFVRQLNMYGFHKIHADGGKETKEHDELKFYHPFFRKNQQLLMRNIKRKITVTHRVVPKTEIAETTTQVTNVNHMTKVLVDVKQLQTRQESVDNQLASMKKENAALWRELALLRQKHMKQQQLVNKLIHFLVHIVNPSRGNMGGMSRKRKFPLMINDIASASKSQKTTDSSSDDGIIIHEVENEYTLPTSEQEPEFDVDADVEEEEEEEVALIDSSENMMDSTDEFLDIPMTDEAVDSTDSLCPDNMVSEDQEVEITEAPEEQEEPPSIVDLGELIISPSPSMVELMFPNMSSVHEAEMQVFSGNQEAVEIAIEDKSKKKKKKKKKKRKSSKSKDQNDFENHLEATQEELETIKELLLDGYALDPNTVLNLNSSIFTDMPLQLFMSDDNLSLVQAQTQKQMQEATPSTSKTNDDDLDFSCDPMVSGSGVGSELMPYNMPSILPNMPSISPNVSPNISSNISNTNTNTSTLLDFENLFENETSPENTMDPAMDLMDLVNMADSDNQSTLNTPVHIKMEPPNFPSPASFNYNNNNNNNRSSSSRYSSNSNNKKYNYK